LIEFLISLREGLSEVLKNNLIGIYLHGSLVLGDFNCKTSDIDFVVLTEKILSSELPHLTEGVASCFIPW
jgi:streptomycin 3"-adenylyltransferase